MHAGACALNTSPSPAMAIKESILRNMLHDLTICQQLHAKLDPKNADWRPAENMRPTIHLMQYLTFIGISTVKHFVNPMADRAAAGGPIMEASKNSGAVTFENFPEAIEREKQQIAELLANVTDNDLLTKKTYPPWGGPDILLFDALMGITMRYLTAYRHQLFLYAKMCGADINTRDNWRGLGSAIAAEHGKA
jgi:hypothetical protein